MNEEELYKILTTLNIPVAYDHFTNDDTVPPFILYRNDDPSIFNADDISYFNSKNFIVDLVTNIKDTNLENQLETLFNNNHIAYDKMGDDYIDSEKIYQIRYTI